MIEVLFLLLPVAAASGWWLARRDIVVGGRSAAAHPDFLRGLNYLLEEQADKAIDTFLTFANVDGETWETFLGLGNLFRRRGELDRAIRIHQNLVSRKNLTTEKRGSALFELGQDYLRAGLLDRAEEIFKELVEFGLNRQQALQALLDIYQQERDWPKCLEVASRLKALSGQSMAIEIAQFHCELAEEARNASETDKAQRHLLLAQEADPNCVRAVMLEGMAALERGEPEHALGLFLKAAERGGAYVPEILPSLIAAMHQLGRGEELPTLLRDLARRHASPPLMLRLADVVAEVRGPEAALAVLTKYLSRYAALSVLERALVLQSEGVGAEGKASHRAAVELEVVRHLLTRQPDYQCEHCGFQARTLHWQCPSCRSWGKVVPVQPDPIVGDEVLRERRLA